MPRELVEVAPGVHVATSRTMLTTSTVVVDGRDALLVDPAWHPDELDALADALEGRGLRVVGGIATHAHHDHLLWHPRFGDAPRWASARTVELADTHRADLLAALVPGPGAGWTPELLDVVGRVEPWPGPTAGGEGAALLVVHDGHAPGHAAVWLEGPRVLLAGDMLSDVELPLPLDPDDLPAYLDGLDRLAPYVARARVVVPGHGRPSSDPQGRLDADRRYLDALLAGREPDDPRRANDGMAEVHARVAALAAALPR